MAEKHSANATVLSTALDHGTCYRGGWNVMPHVRVLLMVPCAQQLHLNSTAQDPLPQTTVRFT